MASLEFLPNTPTLMNAGRELQQLSACFVLPVDDSMESIFGAIRDAALVHQSGGGTGFSFSRLRPKNDLVKSTMGVASGPVSFMRVFDMATETIKQGGTRRGANMGILRVDHPDIMEFIRAKEDEHILNNFNISVGVTEEFMAAVLTGGDYALRNPRDHREVGRLNAREVFDLIVDLAWKNGEPGIVFLDRLNRDNPTPKVGEIESTNPCGEQPLLPYESCNLGSINLALMVKDGAVDWERLRRVTRTAVHFLDNVIDMNRYPLPEIGDDDQEQPQDRARGHGLGRHAGGVGHRLRHRRRHPAGSRGDGLHPRGGHQDERGAGGRPGRLPQLGGEHLGSAGASGCATPPSPPSRPPAPSPSSPACSSGVEPIFALAFIRNVMDNTELPEAHPALEEVLKKRGLYSEDLMKSIAAVGGLHDMDVPDDLKRIFVTAHDVSPEWHIRMQAAFQDHVDNAVSKTVNFSNSGPARGCGAGLSAGLRAGRQGRHHLPRRLAAGAGAQHRRGQAQGARTAAACRWSSARRARAVMPVRPSRSPVLRGETREKVTGCGSLYVTVNEDDFGPREVFANMGKAGGCASAVHRGHRPAHLSGVPLRRAAGQDRQAAARHPLPRAAGLRAQPDPVLPGRHRQGPGRQVPSGRRQRGARRWASSRCPSPTRRAPARTAAAPSSTRAAAWSAGRAATPSAA